MPSTAHLKIFSGGAMRPFMTQAIRLFERANAATVDIEFRLTSALKKAIEDGALFDIAVLPRPELDELVEYGAIAPTGTADVARSTVGLAVRAGAPKPDIGSVAALRCALVEARSIAYSDGPSGAYTAVLLEKLGIAERMRPKTKLTGGPVAELVASGEADIGIQQIVAILPVKGAELVARCRANCKMSSSMPPGLHPAPEIASWREPSLRFWRRTRRSSSFALPALSPAGRRRVEFPRRWAETLAPSRFYAHIGLTWGGSADTYAPLFGRR
jgi:molybdate transport system substrate-binding protein